MDTSSNVARKPAEPPDNHKAVQIISPDPENLGGFCINNDEIERIFGHPDITNTPIAIYSMAGAFRKGKSFMLNLFLKYLWAEKEGKEDSWFRSNEEKLTKGFLWRGGREKVTQGIWIWDEPFFKQTPEGMVVIFLLDTQGSFDSSSSMGSTSVIFALSTLISSLQIYNVMDQIQEDSLQNLQLFTEYGKVVKTELKSSENRFQNLLFLVRDWSDTDLPIGLEGGKTYLDEVLQLKVDHKDLSSVRDNISVSFEKVSCCLLPSPGKKVKKRGKSDGNNLKLGDVQPQFLEMVDILVKEIFFGQNVVGKKINNTVVTGTDLINMILEYFEVIKSGKMPDVGTIMQATTKATILAIVNESKYSYQRQMEEDCEEYMGDMELTKTHKQHKKEAIQEYNQQPKFGDQEFITQHREYLEKLLDQIFDLFYKLNNNVKLVQIQAQIRDLVDEAKEKYRTKIAESISETYLENNFLADVKQKCCKDVLTWFEQNTAQFPQDIRSLYHDDIWNWIKIEFQKFEKHNTNKKEAAISEYNRKKVKAYETYAEIIESKTEMYIENIKDSHEEAKREALKVLGDSDNNKQGNDFIHIQEELLKELKDYFQLVFERNQQRERRLIEIASMVVHKSIAEYGSFMLQMCRGRYIKPSVLENEHKKQKENAKTNIRLSTEVSPKIRNKFIEQCDDELEKLFLKVKNMNEITKLITRRRIMHRSVIIVNSAACGAAVGALGGPICVAVGAAVGTVVGSIVAFRVVK